MFAEGSPRYWVEGSLLEGLQTLVFLDLFDATLTEQSSTTNEDVVYCSETLSHKYTTIPNYIATCARYTEKVCRDIFLQCVNCLEILHGTCRIAHRNLHIENFVVEKKVCLEMSCTF